MGNNTLSERLKRDINKKRKPKKSGFLYYLLTLEWIRSRVDIVGVLTGIMAHMSTIWLVAGCALIFVMMMPPFGLFGMPTGAPDPVCNPIGVIVDRLIIISWVVDVVFFIYVDWRNVFE